MVKTFFYYKNFPSNYIMLHKGNCRFCNFGNGIQNNILGNINGLWSNEFNIYDEAFTEATQEALLMPRINTFIKNCRKCNPQI